MTRMRGFKVGRALRAPSMTREKRLQLLKQAHAKSRLQEPKEEFAPWFGGQGSAGKHTDLGGNE
jgi:hypothetical protein